MGLALIFGAVRITQEQTTCTDVETYGSAALWLLYFFYDAARKLLTLYHFSSTGADSSVGRPTRTTKIPVYGGYAARISSLG
jgi:hypothetical protein